MVARAAGRSRVARDVSTAAFVLRTRPHGESDRLVTVLTEEHGKLTGIAKGAKNSRRRFAGTLEPFMQIRAVFQVRPHSDLVFLHRCELMTPLHGFTNDLARYAAGSYVLELADRMVLGHESSGEVYRLVRDTLESIDRDGAHPAVLGAFELRLLAVSGYEPSFGACRSCGRPVGGTPSVYLVAERGGFLCRPCVAPGEIVRPVSADTARRLATLAAASFEQARSGEPPTPEMRAVIEALLLPVLNGPLRSRAFLGLGCVDSPIALR
ncbi:MAG TPA: DNA repair protein RecO [Candidatus Limnocylindria bacterium]|nr:DNA repair protein RecO [Candidatus Limnocylindria bacterium]